MKKNDKIKGCLKVKRNIINTRICMYKKCLLGNDNSFKNCINFIYVITVIFSTCVIKKTEECMIKKLKNV